MRSSLTFYISMLVLLPVLCRFANRFTPSMGSKEKANGISARSICCRPRVCRTIGPCVSKRETRHETAPGLPFVSSFSLYFVSMKMPFSADQSTLKPMLVPKSRSL